MKSKAELAALTGETLHTLNYWLHGGILPPASGVNKRIALWPDYAVDLILKVRAEQSAGRSLAEIKQIIEIEVARYERAEIADHIEKLKEEHAELTDPAKRKERILAALQVGDKGQKIDIFDGVHGGRELAFVTFVSDERVNFASVTMDTVGGESVLDSLDMSTEHYAGLCRVLAKQSAMRGDFFDSRGLAFTVLTESKWFTSIMEVVEALQDIEKVGRNVYEMVSSKK